ncbi:hypothetical protein P4O66_010527 [Electrophorus voltai]|uniref:Uncharacterized protein n=1 Tax=Electrophorus voltai TaxID=2609070 RepID=A0AAD8ZAD5_9TELE|nr:hypothetical protein P4O66_010527 [Electrophorus voltai]
MWRNEAVAVIFFSMSMWLAGVDVNEYCHHKQHANGSITFFLNNVSSCDEYSWLSDGTVVATDDNGNTSLVQHWECFNIIFKTCQPNVTFKTSCTVNIISCPYDCPTESGNANLHLNTTTLGPQKYGGFGVWSIVAVAVTVAIAIAVVFILWTRKKRVRVTLTALTHSAHSLE